MYIPSFNSFTGSQEILAFIKRYSFATIVTDVGGVPEATHLPFLVKQENDKIILWSHFAKANPHSRQVFDKTSLVIFTEPHAYISPSNYETETVVPTWNYIAVHAYGTATPLEGAEQKAELLKHTIETFEPGYFQQWQRLPDDYRSRMTNGIVAFKIEVSDLQAKKKLSQNRSQQEIKNIISSLDQSNEPNAKQIAAYMSKLSQGQKD